MTLTLFFLIWPLLVARTEILTKISLFFLVDLVTPKGRFEIYWPLVILKLRVQTFFQPFVLLDASHFCTDAAAAFQSACLASSQVATLIHPNGSEMWSYFLGWLALAQNPAILQSFVERVNFFHNNKKKSFLCKENEKAFAMHETKSYLNCH